ncbi:MAG: hypothetical protein U9N57_01795 [Pseudomonadota bacterium]|nr:hypothetical protein [Pseudomonadota bacterium]
MSKLKSISTFGEFMVCPNELRGRDVNSVDIHDIGKNAFFHYKFRHLSQNYHANSVVDENVFLEKIMDSLNETVLQSQKEPLLLLSDGKDSMGLAVSFAEMGVRCKTLTFLRRDDSELRRYITDVASALGHVPYFVTVDEIQSSYDVETFMAACKFMKTPVLDQGFFFFLFGCKFFFEKEGFLPKNFVIVDGLGNDEYFGYLPSKNQLKSFSLSKSGLWKFVPRSFPVLRWYIRSPSEAHGDLSALAAFFPFGNSFDLNKYFSKLPKSLKELEFVDFRAFSRGSFHDHQCMMGKTVTTAKFLGSDIVFPWTDEALAHYCFNLPVSAKFDFKSLKNKLLLRDLLEKKIGWKQEKRGVDLYFDLDMKAFKENILKEFVPQNTIDQIDKSVLISDSVKQRAYLELHNFYGYCLSNGMSQSDVENILMGKL